MVDHYYEPATGCKPEPSCPVCDADRARHKDDCPALILRQLVDDVSAKTGLEVDVSAWERMLDEIEKSPRPHGNIALCIAPSGMSVAAQIAAIYGETGTLLLPLEMSTVEFETRRDALEALTPEIALERMSELFNDLPRKREYRLAERERFDAPIACEPAPNHRQSYLRFNQAPNRFRGGKRGRKR